MDKTERLLRMVEHPEQYSDEEWQQLLSDEECRDLYEVMRLSASAFAAEDAKRKIAEGIKDEEWRNLELRVENLELEEGEADSQFPNSQLSILNSQFLKIAAAFIGVLMLSGIAYAAIHNFVRGERLEVRGERIGDTTAVANSSLFTLHSSLSQDSTVTVFENAPLDSMLTEVASYYNKEVDFRSGQARSLRLYYKWNRKDDVQTVVDDLNHFEQVRLSLANDRLTVE